MHLYNFCCLRVVQIPLPPRFCWHLLFKPTFDIPILFLPFAMVGLFSLFGQKCTIYILSKSCFFLWYMQESPFRLWATSTLLYPSLCWNDWLKTDQSKEPMIDTKIIMMGNCNYWAIPFSKSQLKCYLGRRCLTSYPQPITASSNASLVINYPLFLFSSLDILNWMNMTWILNVAYSCAIKLSQEPIFSPKLLQNKPTFPEKA